MELITDAGWAISLGEHWPFWTVGLILIAAAVIDGLQLRIPNWITYPMVISGWIYSVSAFGWSGLGWSLLGTVVGLALLLPAYAVGAIGAGDVKLLAGIGAWVHVIHTLYVFGISAIVGGVIAASMVLWAWGFRKDTGPFCRTPKQTGDLAASTQLAADRKPPTILLPYSIPITIGTIIYFAWAKMLI